MAKLLKPSGRGLFVLCAALVLLSGFLRGAPMAPAVAPPELRTLFVAPGGSDVGGCSRSAPCASFGRAYSLAAPGAVVEVAAGSYPLQTLVFDPGKASGPSVVFRPAAGAVVSLAEFISGSTKEKIGARHFELRDMSVRSYVRVRWGSEDVTLRNLDAGGLNLTSARNVRVLGGDYGPMVDGVSHINACGVSGCFPAEDILIDGAYFHDYTITNTAKHSECLMIWPGRRVTIRNSTFRNCTDFDVLVKPYKTSLVGSPGEIVLENNAFDEPMPGNTATAQCVPNCPRGGNAIGITQGGGESWGNVQVRYNSSLGGIRVDPMISNVSISGNIARKDSNYSCQRNAEFSNNVWNGARCGRGDRRAPLDRVFVEGSSRGFDLRLKAGSTALAAGGAGSAPVRDMRGALRPLRFRPDVGALQREPASILPGRAIGRVALGMRRADVLAAYGRPAAHGTAQIGAVRLRFDSLRAPGGHVRALYAGDRVVGIATVSPFYATAAGLGPGEIVAEPRQPVCVRPYRPTASRGLYLRTRRGRVAEVLVLARGYRPDCR